MLPTGAALPMLPLRTTKVLAPKRCGKLTLANAAARPARGMPTMTRAARRMTRRTALPVIVGRPALVDSALALRVARRLLGVEREGGGGGSRRRPAGVAREGNLEAERLAGVAGQGSITCLRALHRVAHQLSIGRVEITAVELRAVEVVARHSRRGDVDGLDGEGARVLQAF